MNYIIPEFRNILLSARSFARTQIVARKSSVSRTLLEGGLAVPASQTVLAGTSAHRLKPTQSEVGAGLLLFGDTYGSEYGRKKRPI
jgi:hypothetical protein